jgi:hypothetical protein
MTDTNTKELLTQQVAALPDTGAVAALLFVTANDHVAVNAPNMSTSTLNRLLDSALNGPGVTYGEMKKEPAVPLPLLIAAGASVITLLIIVATILAHVF